MCQFHIYSGVTVYLVPPGILSPGTLYPGVKCPTLVYVVPGDTLPRLYAPLKLISYLFFFYNFIVGMHFLFNTNQVGVTFLVHKKNPQWILCIIKVLWLAMLYRYKLCPPFRYIGYLKYHMDSGFHSKRKCDWYDLFYLWMAYYMTRIFWKIWIPVF